MALTIKQYPASSGTKLVHQTTYPIHYTVQSDLYGSYSDFKYKFELNTDEGVAQTTFNPPYVKGGLGVFQPNILKNLVSYNFNPEITNFTKSIGGIINYRVDVDEYSNTLGSPDSESFEKAIAINGAEEDMNWQTYKCNYSTRRMLTKWRSVRKVTLEDRGTNRILSGKFKAGTTAYDSYVYKVILHITKPNGDLYGYHSQISNPYYNNTTNAGVSSNNNTLEDLSEYLLDIPTGPYNLNQMTWWKKYWIPSGGGYTPITPTVYVTDIFEVGDKYKIMTYTWPKGNNGVTCQAEQYEIVKDCQNTAIQFGWENEVGGTDFFTSFLNKTKVSKNSKTSYEQIRDVQGHFSSQPGDEQYIGHTDYDRGETIIQNTTTEIYESHTDWLTPDEMLDLESLFSSKNVFVRLDKWYPITILNEDVIVNTDQRGLKNYTIKFRIANKKIN